VLAFRARRGIRGRETQAAVFEILVTAMKPIWIKYWGLIPMTRRGYLIATALAVMAVVVTFVVLGSMGKLPPFRSLWEEVPIRTPVFLEYWLHNNLYRLVAVLLAAHVVDTLLVLRRFSKKEAELAAKRPQEQDQPQVKEPTDVQQKRLM
jgi:hypothetical protein